MGTPLTEIATGAAKSAASPAAAGTRSPNPTQLAATASASRTRIGILPFSGNAAAHSLETGGRFTTAVFPLHVFSLIGKLTRRPGAVSSDYSPILTAGLAGCSDGCRDAFGVLCGAGLVADDPLPRPTTFQLDLECHTQEGPDYDDETQHEHAFECR